MADKMVGYIDREDSVVCYFDSRGDAEADWRRNFPPPSEAEREGYRRIVENCGETSRVAREERERLERLSLPPRVLPSKRRPGKWYYVWTK
jgi:hypothetical protein